MGQEIRPGPSRFQSVHIIKPVTQKNRLSLPLSRFLHQTIKRLEGVRKLSLPSESTDFDHDPISIFNMRTVFLSFGRTHRDSSEKRSRPLSVEKRTRISFRVIDSRYNH